MEATPELASFKKVIIFGSKGSGKTSLSRRLEYGSFSNESPTDNGKINLFNFYIKLLSQEKYILTMNKIKHYI